MRILYLTHTVTWSGGGIFFTAFHQGRYLARAGHQVTLLTISPTARFRLREQVVEGVRIVEMPDLLPGLARTGWDLWDCVCRILYLWDKKFDLIHGFESRPVVALPALWLRKKTGVPLILTWADWFGKGGRSAERPWPIRWFMAPVEEFCEKYFYPLADFVIVMGEPLFEMAVNRGIPKRKLLTLLHGSDVERIRAIPKASARLALAEKLPEGTLFIGYLGYLWSLNADFLFQTLRQLKSQITQPVKLLLIGNHRVNLKKMLPGDLRNDVIETGWVSAEAVNLYLCASDVLLLPLVSSPVSENIWPSKINDYFAAGRPVVATKMRILQPIYKKQNFGCLTDDQPEALASAIHSIFLQEDKAQYFGSNARLLAEKELAWGKIVEKLEALYSSLVPKVA